MERGAAFPDVITVYDGESYWLVDGFHRVEAALSIGAETIGCEVIQGTQTDAQWMSFGVNAQHGQRRTSWDVRRAITAALQHPMSQNLSDRAIAEHVRCDHKTVGTQRKKLESTGDVPQSDTRACADGRTMNVTGINANRGSVPVEEIQPPDGGWPEPDESGAYPTELAEPIFENRRHAQAVIHVLEVESPSWMGGRRYVANAGLIGVSGCELAMPLTQEIANADRATAIGQAAECLAVHIVSCLERQDLLQSRRESLEHFLDWVERQGADRYTAMKRLREREQRRKAAILSDAELFWENLSWFAELTSQGLASFAYGWPEFIPALLDVSRDAESPCAHELDVVSANIDLVENRFAAIIEAIRGITAQRDAA